MTRTVPDWLDEKLFPFESKWIDADGETLHFVDEGKGEIILFAHGTPEWSFGYRDMIRRLRSHYRCVAIDMLGFGLSDKNPSSDYTCQAHARRLSIVIEKLGLRNITIVANDFGGAISLAYAIDHPQNVNNIVLFNTWMWSLKDDPHYSKPATTLNSWLGRVLYLTFNAPVNIIMPSAYGNKKLLTPHIHAHYKNALPKGERIAAYAFAKELMNASDWWQSLWEKADVLKSKKMLFFWGMKDKFIPTKELEKWKAKFPDAKVVTFSDAGHFVQEEKPEEMSRAIDSLLVR
ncbi:MAG TPA: alpha/beta fold hydrolase [Chryseosolibacter sp.]